MTKQSSVAKVKRSVHVLLPTEISEEDLRLIATAIQSQDPKFDRTFIVYHVEGMDQSNVAWATTYFTPSLQVEILGLTQNEVEQLQADVPEAAKDVAGAWLDKTPFTGGRIELRLTSGSYSIICKHSDGSESRKFVTAAKTPAGTRYDLVEANSFGEYFVVNRRGDLEFWDREGLISTAAKAL